MGRKTDDFTQIASFGTITAVWIHRWLQNNAQNLKWHIRDALLFFDVSIKFQGHMGRKIGNYDPNWTSLGCNSSLNSQRAMKWCTKLEVALEKCRIVFEVIRQILRSHGPINRRLGSDLSISRWQLQFQFLNGYEMACIAFRSMKSFPIVLRGHPSNFKVTRVERSIVSIWFDPRLRGHWQLSNPSCLSCLF